MALRQCEYCLKHFEKTALPAHLNVHKEWVALSVKLSQWDREFFLKDLKIQPWEDSE